MPYTIPSSVISPGSVYQPRQRPILNRIPGAIAAWSTRRLISSAPADIARGRDASTTEQDFTAAELAGTGFTDLAGAGDGFYVTLYDQIGSNNATQSTAASQPKGVSAGSLIVDASGRPVMEFDGVDDFLISNTLISLSSDFCISFNIVFNLIAFRSILGNSTSDRFYLETANTCAINIGGAFIRFTRPSGTFSTGVVYNFILTRSGANLTLYVDNIAQTSSSTSSNTFVINYFGKIPFSNFFSGKLNDLVVFNKNLSASEVAQLYSALI